MYYLCVAPPELSWIQISWGDAMELDIELRNALVKMLEEQRDREIAAHKRVGR